MAFKRWITLFFTILTVLVSVNAQTSACAPATGDVYRIGAIFPESSLFTVQNAEFYQGLQAMVEAVNACGGIKNQIVEIVFEPATDRESAILSAQALASQGIDVILSGGGIAIHEGLAEIATDADLLIWNTTETNIALSPNVLTANASLRQRGEATAQYFKDALGAGVSYAVIYQDNATNAQVVRGIRTIFEQAPTIEYAYTDLYIREMRLRAEQVRDQGVQAVFVITRQRDTENIWDAFRDEDANPLAFISFGTMDTLNVCQRFGATDGLITVEPFPYGLVDTPLTTAFLETYKTRFDTEPGVNAYQVASSTAFFLTQILPQVDITLPAPALRDAIVMLDIAPSSGLMGEGFHIDLDRGRNLEAVTLIRQSQDGDFCTLSPASMATCMTGFQPAPTWYERAIRYEERGC